MASRKPSSKKTSNKSGCLIWLLLLLLTLLLFVFKWDDIKKTLETTGFNNLVSAPVPKQDVEEPKPSEPIPAPEIKPVTPEPEPTSPVVSKPEPEVKKPNPQEQKGTETKPAVQSPAPQAPKTEKPKITAVEQIKNTRLVSLFFIKVDDDGVITRHEVKRTINVSNSPLTDALNALMAGPSADELSKGFISLIPQNTVLLSAQMRGSTAFLNFTEAFMYNRYGVEGYAGQLKQIIYTATSFTTVKDVQILIDGQKRDFLGGDGVYIGKPLSRASF